MVVRVKVKIGSMVFDKVNHVECRSNIKDFTKTAIIKLPKKIRFKSNGKPSTMYDPQKNITDYIKVGDPVEIYMGYDAHLIKEFEGYVAKGLEPSIPIEVYCECEMWKLKQHTVNVSMEKANIKDIVKAIAPEYETESYDAEIGSFSMKGETPIKVLQELKKRFGMYSYFMGKTLVVGKPYSNNRVRELETKVYKFGHNVIESSLKYIDPNGNKIKVKAINIKPDNSRDEITVGDKTGDTRTLHFFDTPKSDMEKMANELFRRFKHRTLEGSIRSFGFPVVEIGQTVQIIDENYDKRNSKHFVDEVKVWLGAHGFRREITIGLKA